jgi:hypothetical protein
VVEQAARSTIERRLGDDGVGYAWTEFESYFDVDIAAAIWEAAEVDAAPEPTQILIYPRFELGSIVRVLRTRHLAFIRCTLRESLWRRSMISLMMGITSSD